ncbi:MAG: hypothetical protein H6709_07725 [Kofleriaceae bacterium]|nr:hypothetical protein [Kofleriaceae bacterium]
MAAALAAATALAGCARTLPPQRSSAVLYRDLERLVTISEATGWAVDRIELEKVLPAALDSVCRVEPPARAALRTWLDAEIERRGGPVEAAWRRRGKKLSRVSDLLTLTRVRAVLGVADVAADGDCPFWLEPQEPFEGRQISDGRWELSFGGGGKGIVVLQGEDRDISFGGAGRLLLGRVFDDRSSVFAGVELGATASFPKSATGDRGALVFGFDVVAPVVYRYTLTNAYLEAEAGWLGHVTEEDLQTVDPGVHVGIAVGGRAMRTRFLFPGVALGLSYERTFPGDGGVDPLTPVAPLTTIKLGLRAAFDLDL